MTFAQELADAAALLYPDSITTIIPEHPEILVAVVPTIHWDYLKSIITDTQTSTITCDESTWNAPIVSAGGNKVIAFLPQKTLYTNTVCYLSLAEDVHLSGSIPDNYTVTYSKAPIEIPTKERL